MQIKHIRASKSKGYLTVGIVDGDARFSFNVSERDYTEAGSPRPGDAVDYDMLDCLRRSDEIYRARLYALRMLAFADNNERTLVHKLVLRGISYEIATDTAHEMVGRGYINESAQLERLVLAEANRNLIGPRRIRAKLSSRGYSTSDIDETIERLCADGEIDFERSAKLLVEKKLTRGATDDEIKRLLYKSGYNIC